MSPPQVQLRLMPPMAWITLDRPGSGNACSAALVQALHHALDSVTQSEARVLVVRGEGRHFCTGFDLAGMEAETDDSLLARFVRLELLLQRIARAPQLTIAIAHGRSMGAGADLFAACDLRIACAGSSFAFPGARGFGLVLGSRRLACRVGARLAHEWIGSGAPVDVEAAVGAGLVTHRCANADEAAALAGELAEARGAGGMSQHAPIRAAIEPFAADHDAHDLARLVRSAAVPGLQARITRYAAPHTGTASKNARP